MNPDQTAPVGAVRSGSTMFASLLTMLNGHFQMQLFCWLNNVFCVYTEVIMVIAQEETDTFE